jgi:hypothetical protein
MTNKSITITVDHNDETLVFKLMPTTTIEALLYDIEDIVSLECVTDGEEMGLWTIV